MYWKKAHLEILGFYTFHFLKSVWTYLSPYSHQNLGTFSKFCFWHLANLSKLINFYFPWNQQKTMGFLMISGGIEVKLHKYTNTLNIRSENCRQFLKNGFKFCFTPLRSASKMLYQNCKLAVYNLIKRGSAITFLRDWCRHYYRYLEAVIYRRCSI